MSFADPRRRVSVKRCKPYANPHHRGDMPKYLPAGLTQYVLNKFSKKSPPYHITEDDVWAEVENVHGHQSVGGQGGVIAVMYEAHWTRRSRPSWKRKTNLLISR